MVGQKKTLLPEHGTLPDWKRGWPFEQLPNSSKPASGSVVSRRTTTFWPAVTWKVHASEVKKSHCARSSVPDSVGLHASHVALHAEPSMQVPTPFRSQTSSLSRKPFPHGSSQN